MGGHDQSRFDNRDEEFLSSREAAAFLGVKPSTLYTYVSRGLIEAVPGGDGRKKRYARADLAKIKTRSDARAGHAAVASGALRWGDPVIDTEIAGITARGPCYRGHAAVDLARSGISFEAVAELLWGEPTPPSRPAWPREVPRIDLAGLRAHLAEPGPPLSVLVGAVGLAALGDPDRFASPDAIERARARRLIRALAAWLGLSRPDDPKAVERAYAAETVSEAVAAAFGRESGVEAIEQALILCADHGLNVSAFAARVTASSGADLYACLTAALATLSGPRHGGVCDRVEALVREAGAPERAARAVRERLQRGSRVPGFTHPFYPKGDPRAVVLLDIAASIAAPSLALRTLQAIVDAMRDNGHGEPSLDIGLTAVSLALDLGPGAGGGLFAIGRAAGWVAHILEQRRSPHLLRPRARYTGPLSP